MISPETMYLIIYLLVAVIIKIGLPLFLRYNFIRISVNKKLGQFCSKIREAFFWIVITGFILFFKDHLLYYNLLFLSLFIDSIAFIYRHRDKDDDDKETKVEKEKQQKFDLVKPLIVK